jgi:hypothetical protein
MGEKRLEFDRIVMWKLRPTSLLSKTERGHKQVMPQMQNKNTQKKKRNYPLLKPHTKMQTALFRHTQLQDTEDGGEAASFLTRHGWVPIGHFPKNRNINTTKILTKDQECRSNKKTYTT